jgi:putative restriction endonuclease
MIRHFECGLITITEDLKIKVSSSFLKNQDIPSIKHNFIDYNGKSLIEPQKFFPDVEFLKVHNERFKA